MIDNGFRSAPEQSREFTSKELSKMLGMTTTQINYIAKKYNLNQIIRGRKAYYDYYAYKQIEFILKMRALKVEVTKKDLKKLCESSETEEDQHPLVIDKRFLQLGFFPDVVPNCFYDTSSF